MSPVDFLATVALPAFVGGGSAWLLLQFLGEKIVTHKLQKDLERYKIELSEKTDVLKTQLAIFSHEQSVAISRVDSQRAEAIHKVYGCIRAVINPLSEIVAGCPIIGGAVGQSNQYYRENAERAHAACGALAQTLSDLAIYFDNDTYEEIATFYEASMDGIGNYLQDLRRLAAHGASPHDLLAAAEANRKPLEQAHRESIHPHANKLTVLFREQLGIQHANTSTAQ